MACTGGEVMRRARCLEPVVAGVGHFVYDVSAQAVGRWLQGQHWQHWQKGEQYSREGSVASTTGAYFAKGRYESLPTGFACAKAEGRSTRTTASNSRHAGEWDGLGGQRCIGAAAR